MTNTNPPVCAALPAPVVALASNTGAGVPVITELFKLLPPPGSKWSAWERVCFLRACAAAFSVVYGDTHAITVNTTPHSRW